MADPEDTTTSGSQEQPEEFPLENVIADYVDYLLPAFANSSYSKIIWVNPSSEEFKRTTFLNKIDTSAKYDIKQDMDKLTQLQLAAITPVIQLYRRDYSGKSLDSYKDRLFMFNNIYPSDSAIQSVNSGLQTKEQFLNSSLVGVDGGNPVLMSSALTNVQYTFAGRNPVESERSIDVTLSMKFASFEALVGKSTATLNLDTDLVGKQSGQSGQFPTDNTDYTDAGGTTNVQGVTKNFLSLITHPPSDTQLDEYAEVSKVYEPSKFRVYLKFGWRAIHNKEIFGDSFTSFVDSINSGEHDKGLLLNLINHELTFNEEGEIELKVNYIGSLDTSLTNGDSDFVKALYLLRMEKLKKEVTEQKQSDAALKGLEQISKWVNRDCGDVKADDPIDKQRTELNNTVQEKKEELAKKRQSAVNDVYSMFLDTLINFGPLKGAENIKLLSINYDQVALFSANMPNEQRDTGWIEKVIKNKPFDTQGSAGVDAAKKDVEVALEATQNQEAKDAGNTDKWFGNDLNDVKKTSLTSNPFGINAFSSGQIFKITNVGNLLDGLLVTLEKSLTNNGTLSDAKEQENLTQIQNFVKSFYLMLGDYYFYPRGSEPMLMPIAKIPINFESFLVWYTDNIVKKQRKNYVIRDFISDFFTGLVIPTLRGYDSAGKIGRQYSVVFDQRQITAKGFRTTNGLSPCNINADRSIDNSIVNSLVGAPGAATIASGTEPEAQYNIIYISLKVTDPDSRGRIFQSLEKDRAESISHFWVGDTKGMIKSIKFKRVEQPGLKEAKATKEAFIPLNQLRDLYNTDISMFGNHYYYPGDMIFIHPQNSILGEPWQKKPRSISNIMGIGGYYDVIKVSSNIGEGGYETNLECIWTCSGEEFERSEEEKKVECRKIAREYNESLEGSGLTGKDLLKVKE